MLATSLSKLIRRLYTQLCQVELLCMLVGRKCNVSSFCRSIGNNFPNLAEQVTDSVFQVLSDGDEAGN